jgi:hypothetical protein
MSKEDRITLDYILRAYSYLLIWGQPPRHYKPFTTAELAAVVETRYCMSEPRNRYCVEFLRANPLKIIPPAGRTRL